MLVQTQNVNAVVDRIAGDLVRGFTVRHFCYSNIEKSKPKILVDNETSPSVLVAHVGTNFVIYGEIDNYLDAMSDLLHSVHAIDPEEETVIPPTSLMREFIGGSAYTY